MQELSKHERLNQIVKEIRLTNKVDMRSLSILFGVSVDTIRRDIKELDDKGLIQATRGGAVSKSPIPPNYRERLVFDSIEKKKVALKAVTLIQEGQVILLSGGTSIVALASVLPTNIKFTVVTNSFPIVHELEQHHNIEIIFVGGSFSRSFYGTVGMETVNFLRLIRADLFFFAPFSIHPQLGITSNSFENAAMERVMIYNSKKIISLVTSSKIDTAENYQVCDLSTVNTMITELEPTDDKLAAYRNTGIELL